jgi:signal transduction histidine kinase/ActR/RegA family two-component response regulator
MIADGELLGVLSFGGDNANFSEEQIGIAREAATQIAVLLSQARLRERIERQAEELEQRVAERTAELSASNAQLEREIAERRRAEEDASRANRAKSEFLSRMSHELRTPLNGILGFAQLLEMDASEPAEQESVSHILKGGRHLLALIDEVLDISRIEAGRLPISLEPVLVGDTVRTALDLVRPQAAARDVALGGDAGDDERHVTADRQRLQQVLLNLLSNAVKYNRQGGAVTVSSATRPGGRIAIAVADTGMGIPEAMLDRLFTPFDRLGAEQSDVQGTGLGLALSRRLVEAMGGQLLVESRPGTGSTFIVELPAAEAPGRSAATAGASPEAAVRSHGTVLYIEDNVANLRLVERIVERRPGLTLLSAMQGSQGLDLARAHRPRMIMLDLHLPDLHGEEVLARLQDDPLTREIPVVIVSADAVPGDVSRLLARGARSYVTKPLEVGALLALLDDMLAER